MNIQLKKEIINHIFNMFGLFNNNSVFVENIISDKFLLDKKISFINDDNKKYENKIYGISINIENSTINILLGDLKEDVKEYAMIVQMNDMSPHAIRLAEDIEDDGSVSLNLKGEWIEAPSLVQAKLLVGIESLSEIIVPWKKIENYNDLYKYLLLFLNAEE